MSSLLLYYCCYCCCSCCRNIHLVSQLSVVFPKIHISSVRAARTMLFRVQKTRRGLSVVCVRGTCYTTFTATHPLLENSGEVGDARSLFVMRVNPSPSPSQPPPWSLLRLVIALSGCEIRMKKTVNDSTYDIRLPSCSCTTFATRQQPGALGTLWDTEVTNKLCWW